MHESRGDEHLLAPSTWAVLRQATRAITQLYPLLFSRAGLPITQFTPLKAVYETDQLAKWQYSKENNITVKTLSRGSEPCARRAGCRPRRTKGEAGIYSLTELGREVVLSALPRWRRGLELKPSSAIDCFSKLESRNEPNIS